MENPPILLGGLYLSQLSAILGNNFKPGQDMNQLYNEAHENFTYTDGHLINKVSKSGKSSEYLRQHPSYKKAGHVTEDGYLRTRVGSKKYLVHRIIYLMHYRTLPAFVSHIDGNPLNNLIANLRAATRAQCLYTRGPSRKGKIARGHKRSAEYKGVSQYWSSDRSRIRHQAQAAGNHLGYFKTPKDAAHAYDMHLLFNLPDNLVTFAYFNFQKGGIPTMKGIEAARAHWIDEEL